MHLSAESMPGATLYVPFGQSEQPSSSDTAPCFIPCFPGGQETQPLWTSLTKNPFGHCLQSRDAASAKKDCGQARQAWPLFAVPAGQVEQNVCPVPLVTFSESQGVQKVCPGLFVYLPTPQSEHESDEFCPSPVPFLPGLHWTHFPRSSIPGTLL